MARTFKGHDWTDLYVEVLHDCYYNPDFVCEPRGLKISEMLNVSIEYTDPAAGAVIDFSKTGFPERQTVYDAYRRKEHDWYMSGSLKAADINAFWLKIANEEGNVVSNYGYITMHEKKYNWRGCGEMISGVENVVRTLLEDPDSRRALIHYNEPRHSAVLKVLDMPCSMSDQFFIRNNTMYLTHSMRSNCLTKGISYDMPWCCTLLKHVLDEYNTRSGKTPVAMGSITFFDGSLHFYHKEPDITQVKKILGVDLQKEPGKVSNCTQGATVAKWKIMANVPDQDHIRDWVQIGECETLEEYELKKEAYIEGWKPTSNFLRLRELGSFELVKEKK